MTEEEIMIRAREAAAKIYVDEGSKKAIRGGQWDSGTLVMGAAQALRDLSKPLSEIQPVDPDLIEARKVAHDTLMSLGASDEQIIAGEVLAGERDDAIIMHATLAAIKRGRELEQGK